MIHITSLRGGTTKQSTPQRDCRAPTSLAMTRNKIMKYSTFATYLEKLEEISSRLTLIEILSELFKEVDEADVDKIVYLLQGRVAPFFAPVEIGMAEKNVAGALSLAYE